VQQKKVCHGKKYKRSIPKSLIKSSYKPIEIMNVLFMSLQKLGNLINFLKNITDLRSVADLPP
jgi:hypothetical protein